MPHRRFVYCLPTCSPFPATAHRIPKASLYSCQLKTAVIPSFFMRTPAGLANPDGSWARKARNMASDFLAEGLARGVRIFYICDARCLTRPRNQTNFEGFPFLREALMHDAYLFPSRNASYFDDAVFARML